MESAIQIAFGQVSVGYRYVWPAVEDAVETIDIN
jgi:hypothetical protein